MLPASAVGSIGKAIVMDLGALRVGACAAGCRWPEGLDVQALAAITAATSSPLQHQWVSGVAGSVALNTLVSMIASPPRRRARVPNRERDYNGRRGGGLSPALA